MHLKLCISSKQLELGSESFSLFMFYAKTTTWDKQKIENIKCIKIYKVYTFNLLKTKVLKNYLGTKVYEFNLSRTKVLKENLLGIKVYVFNLLRTKVLK